MTKTNPSDLADLLVCPHCRGALEFDTRRQAFACDTHGLFPLAGGFPSFIAGSVPVFEDHWQDNRSDQIAAHKLQIAREFLAPLLEKFPLSAPLRVLDAGCGEGAHVSVLADFRRHADDRLIAMDIAASALRDAARHGGAKWRFIHADMSTLPFRSGAFDAVFSFGVLHLTPVPSRSFAELCRVLRPGGLLGLWVFRGNMITRSGLRIVRAVSRAIGPAGTRALGDILVPLYGVVPSRSGLAIGNSTWRQTREVLLSNLTPPHMHFLTLGDLELWCADQGMTMIPGDGDALTAWAIKR